MGTKTGISWCDHTFNPWWGCEPVSAGCDHCYAKRDAARYRYANFYGHNTAMQGLRRAFGERHWAEPLRWNVEAKAAGVRRRVFCGSMCDVFESPRDAEARHLLAIARSRLFSLIESTVHLDWLLLTKRPEHVSSGVWRANTWPANVWMGTTVENFNALGRIDYLLDIPAHVRFVCFEPLLEALPGMGHCGKCGIDRDAAGRCRCTGDRPRIHWLIIGAESGSQRRLCELDWVRRLVGLGRDSGVPVFVKQLHIDGRLSTAPADWPKDLRVQKLPR